jgi:hypothetical protein
MDWFPVIAKKFDNPGWGVTTPLDTRDARRTGTSAGVSGELRKTAQEETPL